MLSVHAVVSAAVHLGARGRPDGCFESGGPEWLFPVLFGCGGAALIALLIVAINERPEPTRARPRGMRRLLPLLPALAAPGAVAALGAQIVQGHPC